MTPDAFWKIIDQVAEQSRGDNDKFLETLQRALEPLAPNEIVAFKVALEGALDSAYSWKLWGAASVIMGGCSDDGFMDFRCWLVSRGRKTFEAALADPESLAAVKITDPDDCQLESLSYVPANVYQAKTKSDLYDALPQRATGSDEPSGVEWDEGDLPRLFPRLSAKFG